ncbi:MAG: ABC transporter permease [Actinomycetia bacterium]|nr:ABC transporter permease [Actinomycetes bacterium]MCP4085699.1 ABC transporter permease [Actinomycetes bacterium]
MGSYIIRRTLFAIPTLIAISLIIFMILDFAPGDPTAQLPLTIPAEIKEQIRESLGLNDPFFQKWMSWNRLMFINEPLHALDSVTGICVGDCENRDRIISWSSRAPAMDIIYQRLPQTLWVLGLALLLGTLLAIPVGVYSAYKQYSAFDNFGTLITMIGFSVPTFFTGLLAIMIFSVWLGWLPSFYKTTHDVDFTSWSSIWFQIKQLLMPVGVLTMFNAANLSRFTRAAALDNLHEEYVRTARAKGVSEGKVVSVHVMRNSMIPVVTLIALSIPGIFSGAIITEQIFRINGLGALLITAIGQNDIPMVQTLTFIFAVLIVAFNLFADVLYGLLDPRIRYD